MDRFDLATDVNGNMSSIYFYTFRGRMRFRNVYNEAHCEKEVIEGMLEFIRKTLERSSCSEGPAYSIVMNIMCSAG